MTAFELKARLAQLADYLAEGRINQDRYKELVAQAHDDKHKADTGYWEDKAARAEIRATGASHIGW